jgi:hypothetical protein
MGVPAHFEGHACEQRFLDLVIASSNVRQSPLRPRLNGQALRARHWRKIGPLVAIAGKPLRRVSRSSSLYFSNLLRWAP